MVIADSSYFVSDLINTNRGQQIIRNDPRKQRKSTVYIKTFSSHCLAQLVARKERRFPMESKTGFSINDYPLVLKVKHLGQITGLSPSVCYQLCKIEGFPAHRPFGRAHYLIPRDAFFRWLEDNATSPNSDKH